MTPTQRIKELEKLNHKLSIDNLRMRLEFEVLLDGTASKASQKILDKYRRKRLTRNEIDLMLKN